MFASNNFKTLVLILAASITAMMIFKKLEPDWMNSQGGLNTVKKKFDVKIKVKSLNKQNELITRKNYVR